jgi:glycosyltransferase involved in cell wall biosynthesis
MKKIGIDEDNFIVLFIGRFVWSKGVFDLIYAAKRLLEDRELDIEKIKFIFIGRGPEIKAMLELINKLGIEKKCYYCRKFFL